MKSAYVIGGPGSGKSTFTAELLTELGAELGPLEDLLTLPNKKNDVTLRGHRLSDGGLYLGVMRDAFPGTDGLDRASSPVGEAWLESGSEHLPDYLLAEGATLCTRRFLGALERHTDFLLVYLHVDPEIAVRRFAERGSSQAEAWVASRNTAARNRATEHTEAGGRTLSVDTADDDAWSVAVDLVWGHLRG